MPIQVPVVQTGLEKSIQQAATKVGKNMRINMGPGAKSIESLSRPLGRLTGKADEFTKSMEAANARVLAFGASVGVIAAVSNGLKELVTTTIQVEKSLANINSILKQSESQLNSFKNQIFDIARNTGQTFDTVAEAALELSRQGLKAEEVTKRLNDALVLSRLSGLSAADSVAGLTAAVNSFSSAGLTTSDVLNKISAAAASAAVSDRDLIEGLKRSGAVAVASGVQFDELIGIISALQEKTARGGAVIGNSLKTIFVRIQDLERLQSIQRLGVEVTDLEGRVLSSNKIIENLAPTFAKLDQASRVNLADNLVGKFQIAPFLALLEDYNQKISRSGEVANTSLNATSEAYDRNAVLSKALAAAVNTATVNLKELANTLGEIGVTENLSKIIGVFNSVVSTIQDVLDGDSIGSTFAKGLIKGISTIIAGPGLALALVAIGKLLLDFAKFGGGALKTFFGLNRAAEAQAALQGQIAASLLNDKGIRSAILSIEKQNISEGEKKKLQTQFFTKALNEQLMVMKRMQGIARKVAPGVMAGTASRRGGRAAGGFLPIGAESSDISRGVGGAPASAKPVVIPNFAFGSGKRGTMVANSSEYIVPNYANGGDAIFNQNMASSMGLPANARKVRAASGYIPNYAVGPAGALSGSGITSMTQFRALSGAGKTRIIDGVKVTEAQAKNVFDRNAKNKRTTLDIPARIFGVASLFKGKKTADSSTAPGQLSSKLAGQLAAAGVSNIKFNGIQIKSLDDFERNAKVTEKSNRTDIAKRFANPLVGYAQNIIGKTFGNDEKAAITKEIKRLGGSGGTGGARLFSASVEGGILESAMTLATKGVKGIRDFQSNSEDQIPFDFEEKGLASSQFKKTFGFTNKLQKADAKRTASNEAVRTIIKKAFNDKASQQYIRRIAKSQGFEVKRASGGYVPNFADPLQDAIGREKAAGLPVSQIRINQSGKLRSSQNPMGLAVTNTRDEPTGAIPNFAKGDAGQAVDGLTTKLFALQSVMFLFQSGVGEMAEESKGVEKALFDLSQTAIQATMALTAIQALGGVGGVAGMLGGSKGKSMMLSGRLANARLTRSGTPAAGAKAANMGKIVAGGLLRLVAPLAVLAAGFKGIQMINEKLTGSSKLNKEATERLTIAQENAAKRLSVLDVGDKDEFKKSNAALARSNVDFLKANLGGTITGDFFGPLEGSSDEEKLTKIEGLITAAYDAGSTEKEIKNILKSSIAQAQNNDLFQLGTAQTKSLMRSLQSQGNIDRKPLQEQFEREARTTKGFDSDPEVRKSLIKEFEGKNLPTQAIKASLDKLANESKEKLKQIESINLANAKARLKTAIEIRKENLKDLSITDKRLMKAETLGGLDDNTLLALKQKAEQQKLLNGLASKNLDFIAGQRDELTRLKLEEKQIENIEKEILNISTKDLTNKDEVLKIVNKIYTTNGLNDGVAKSLMESLGIQLDQNKGIFDASSKTLKNRQDETRELTTQKQLIKEIEAERSLTAQTIQFGKKNVSAGQRSSIQASLRSLGVQKEAAALAGRDMEVQRLDNQMASLNQSLARVSGDEGQAGIDARARLMPFPESIRNKFNTEFQSLTDPRVDPVNVLRGIGSKLNQQELFNTVNKGSGIMRPDFVTKEDLTKFRQGLGGLEQEMKDNTRAEKDGVDAAKNLALSFSAQARINKGLAVDLAPFSRSESASASRLATAQQNVSSGKAKNVDREFRRLTMERGVFDRIGEAIPTALESSDQLSESLKDASLSFARNIGDAMLDAIEKGGNLGDILLGVASEFLSTMSRAFMRSAVDDVLGSFGIGKQGGGPIRGGSGTRDDVPAMLMGGEFVMNKKAVRKYGVGFMSALNSGSMQGFRSGGQVRDREGMFTTPGMNGAGSIIGASNLLSFATQTPIAMGRDTLTSNGAFLDPESGRLTMFGRRNSPQFQQVQGAKQQAFDLYAGEMNARQQAAAAKKANRKSLMNSLLSAAGSVVVGAGLKSATSKLKGMFGGGLKGMFGGGLKGAKLNGQMAMLPENGTYPFNGATGGLIPAAGGVDTVPAMLSGGEFVMNAAATRNIGAGNLQALNSGTRTGDNTNLVAKLDELIIATETSQSTGDINITINGSNGAETETQGQNSTDQQKALSDKIKTAVKQVIADEKRLGGQLRR